VEAVIQNTVELARQALLENVKEDDVEELLQSHDQGLTNDELRELVQQNIQSESVNSPFIQKRKHQ